VGLISITHNSIEKVSIHCLAVKNLQQKTGSPEKGRPFWIKPLEKVWKKKGGGGGMHV